MSEFEIVDPLVHLVMSLESGDRNRLEELLTRGVWWTKAQVNHANNTGDDAVMRSLRISEHSIEIGHMLIGAAYKNGGFKS